MKILVLCIMALFSVRCGTPGVEHIITQRGGVFEFDGMRLEIPESGVADSMVIDIGVKNVERKTYGHGFSLLGTSFTINPGIVAFKKAALFSMHTKNNDALLAAKIGDGFVPLANSRVENDTLRAQLWHGGTYYIIQKPKQFGIVDHSEVSEALLILSDIYVSDYIENFTATLRKTGYDLPVWIFVYPYENSVRENALFLIEELKRLHEEYGRFRLDLVSFGVGGLVAHRYLADTTVYQNDISSAVIAVGTPFLGSNFAVRDNAREATSPYRFFYIDGLGENAEELEPGSEFITWVKKNRKLVAGHYYDKMEENKNFASVSGIEEFEGTFPEEYEGDGLVSLSSTMLTPIEPEPLELDHFNLFDARDAHTVIARFVHLYRSFTWPRVFSSVWDGKEEFSTICDTWHKEASLIYQRPYNVEILLEYNENILKSTPKNAVLITNGDNDTYPAWYMQNKGVRKDVLIVNRSLFNLKKYVQFMQEQGLPLKLSSAELDTYKHRMEDGEFVSVSDQLIELLLKQKEKPVVFSTTVYHPERYGYPLTLSGMVYEIGDREVDIERTKDMLHNVLSYDKLFSVPSESVSVHVQNLSDNYAAVAFHLAMALGLEEGNEEALEELDFAIQFSEEPFFLYNKARAYIDRGEKEVADSILKALLKIPTIDVQFKKEVAEAYHDAGMRQEAIRLLAECLKTNPDDKEISELIRQYQEEK